MPCLTCGVPTQGKPMCPEHAALKAAQQQRKKEARRSYAHRPSRQQRGYDAAWVQVRALVLANSRQCHYCGAYADTVDHVVPISVDPTLRLDLNNLVPACRACNSSRATRT